MGSLFALNNPKLVFYMMQNALKLTGIFLGMFDI